MPKISIVMPTYNQGKFIKAAIDSILAQTFKDFELIIVDDGSTDQTASLIDPYRRFDQRIRYLWKANGGTGSALNAGFELATGKYETWFASDNIMYPTMLQDLSDYLDTHPDCDYVYANCDIGVMDHTGLIETKRKNIKEEVVQTWDPDVLLHHYILGISWLWRKELRVKAGPFQTEPCEDYDMVLRMVDAGGRFEFYDKCLAWFRRHDENMSKKIAKNSAKIDFSKLVQNKAKIRRGLGIIPKIVHFYWGEKTLPYMRYLTISSFARHNPEWKIKLYTPTIGSSAMTWPSHEHKYTLSVKDYYNALLQLPIEHIQIDFNERFGLSNNIPEVHKSDYLRWYLLSTEGGLWSDMDIVYLAPVPDIPKNRSMDTTGVCINCEYGHSVGFLLASRLNPFYTDIFRLARLNYKAKAYQCLGADLLNREYRHLNAIQQQFPGVFNIHMDIVYPYDATRIPEIYGSGDPMLPTLNIGIHWYAGHGLAGAFQAGQLPNCLLSKILKREGYYAEFYNSFGHC